jgi:hypothetical protein
MHCKIGMGQTIEAIEAQKIILIKQVAAATGAYMRIK